MMLAVDHVQLSKQKSQNKFSQKTLPEIISGLFQPNHWQCNHTVHTSRLIDQGHFSAVCPSVRHTSIGQGQSKFILQCCRHIFNQLLSDITLLPISCYVSAANLEFNILVFGLKFTALVAKIIAKLIYLYLVTKKWVSLLLFIDDFYLSGVILMEILNLFGTFLYLDDAGLVFGPRAITSNPAHI